MLSYDILPVLSLRDSVNAGGSGGHSNCLLVSSLICFTRSSCNHSASANAGLYFSLMSLPYINNHNAV